MEKYIGNGTHSVCMCTIHDNFRLMLDAINVQKINANSNHPLRNYKDCLKKITCQKSTDKFFIGDCNKCPDFNDFNPLRGSGKYTSHFFLFFFYVFYIWLFYHILQDFLNSLVSK